MNYIYVGKGCDINIGNGKTSSAVLKMIESADDDNIIFSNIKLNKIKYRKLTPDSISEVLQTENALVLFDEIHAIIHKNHRIMEKCKEHSVIGLCYLVSEFFRQVRKRNIDTFTTCQTFEDCHFQYRQLMNIQIVCEKYFLNGDNILRKCKCMKDKECINQHHAHYIKQTQYPSSQEPRYVDISSIVSLYDSYEIVQGWVSYD